MAAAAHGNSVTTVTFDDRRVAWFECEILPLYDVMLRRAQRLTASRTDAEDLLQDTMLAAYRGFHTFEAGTNLQAWMFRIMRNCWINNYRRERRRGTGIDISVVERRPAVGIDGAGRFQQSAEDEALDNYPDSRIQEAVKNLPTPQRLAVYLADVEGLAYREIAIALGVPIGTVMSRVARGRARLRASLADMAPRQGRATGARRIA